MFTFPLSKWVGGIRFEHTHRLIASAVGMLTVVLAVWLARREERRWVRRLGYVALGAVVAQGVLGGLTVLFLLPTAVSVAHACLAQTFFCLTVTIAVVTSPRWTERAPVEPARRPSPRSPRRADRGGDGGRRLPAAAASARSCATRRPASPSRTSRSRSAGSFRRSRRSRSRSTSRTGSGAVAVAGARRVSAWRARSAPAGADSARRLARLSRRSSRSRSRSAPRRCSRARPCS